MLFSSTYPYWLCFCCTFLCVRSFVRACVRACVRARMRVRGCTYIPDMPQRGDPRVFGGRQEEVCHAAVPRHEEEWPEAQRAHC